MIIRDNIRSLVSVFTLRMLLRTLIITLQTSYWWQSTREFSLGSAHSRGSCYLWTTNSLPTHCFNLTYELWTRVSLFAMVSRKLKVKLSMQVKQMYRTFLNKFVNYLIFFFFALVFIFTLTLLLFTAFIWFSSFMYFWNPPEVILKIRWVWLAIRIIKTAMEFEV